MKLTNKIWNSDSTEIRFDNHVYFKINGKWWEVEEKNESFFTGSRNISINSPKIIREVDLEQIEKKYIRIKKYNRINENE
jgi:hypothetical protein